MDLHPVIVHFPIALLTIYSLLELVSAKWDNEKLLFARQLLVLIGIVGGIAAFITGEMTGAEDEIAEMHELFGKMSLTVYGILALGYVGSVTSVPVVVERIRDFLLRKWVRIPLAVLGFFLLSVTGALGGIMVHGPNEPFAELVFNILF